MLLLLLAAPQAAAFSPAVHRELAQRGAALEGCPAEEAERFARGAAGEDWNLPRKWGRWHHYHSPSFAPVRSLWRGPSAGRVVRLQDRIQEAVAHGDGDHAWLLAGNLAHHVQDMASPPHVVPVAHGLGDGFERFVTSALVSGVEGADVPTLDPIATHQRLAVETTAALAIPLVCDAETMAWSAFWEPRPGRFGVYGSAGNAFGAVPGCEAGMLAFAQARLDAALAYTRGVARYVVGLEATALRAQ